MFYQLKMIRKKSKPPIWRRAYVPSNITFAQMALILEELLEFPKSDQFEYEFLQAKARVTEWHEKDGDIEDYQYDYLNAPDTYVNTWFGNEKWFSFRIRDRQDLPVYRVEIEKLLDNIVSAQSQIPLNYPLLLKEVSPEDDEYWHMFTKINDILQSRYFLKERDANYPCFAEVVRNVDKKHAGIGFSVELIDRDTHNHDSTMTKMREVGKSAVLLAALFESDDLADKLGFDRTTGTFTASPEEVERASEEVWDKYRDYLMENIERQLGQTDFDESESFQQNVTLREMLSAYSKKELMDIADDLRISLSAKRKDKMASEIAEYLLEPNVMRGELLTVTEEELDAFEKAMDKGYYLPEEEEITLLGPLYELNYIAIYTNGFFEVPEDVTAAYSVLKRDGYRDFHVKAAWMYSCLRAFDAIHVVAPMNVLYRMYKRQKPSGSTYDNFKELLGQIPETINPCCEIDGRIVSKSALTEDVYKLVEEHQRDVDYYIPTKKEIMIYAKYGYPSNDKAYHELFRFMQEELDFEEEECNYLCTAAFNNFSSGKMPSDYTDLLEEMDIEFESEDQVNELVMILMRVNNSTRMYELRGHTPNEMMKMGSSQKHAGAPTIVPMSSEAAELLESSRQEIEGMGFTINTDSNADKIPTMGFPDGASGKMVPGVKKIYPNDPCPCGSGKKYKNCCGRKTK